MGAKVRTDRSVFISFEVDSGGFRGWIHLTQDANLPTDADRLIAAATRIYSKQIEKLRHQLNLVLQKKNAKLPIPAVAAWHIGDEVFRLVDSLGNIDVEISDLYSHICRDVPFNRKWLEKVITFRRYIKEPRIIPRKLSWGQCQSGTRQVATRLQSANSR